MATYSTTANGTYADCGYGMPVALSITCGGTSCPALDSYPNLVCTTDATTTNCNNKVTCPQKPNFQSVFELLQENNSTVISKQQLSIDDQSFSGTDNGNGQIAYVANGQLPSSSTSSPGVATTTGKTVPTTTVVVASNGQFSVPRRSNSRLFLGLIMIMSIFVAQIQAHSNHMWGGISSVLNTGSIMVIPLIWPLLLSGVHGQCFTGVDYGVR